MCQTKLPFCSNSFELFFFLAASIPCQWGQSTTESPGKHMACYQEIPQGITPRRSLVEVVSSELLRPVVSSSHQEALLKLCYWLLVYWLLFLAGVLTFILFWLEATTAEVKLSIKAYRLWSSCVPTSSIMIIPSVFIKSIFLFLFFLKKKLELLIWLLSF